MRMHQILMPCVVAMSLVCGTARAALINPGFETDNASAGDVGGATGWGGFNFNFTTAGQHHSGSQSLKLFGPFFVGGGSGVFQAQPAVTGTSYTASAFALTPTGDSISGNNFAAVAIEFYNASNTQIGRAESSHLTSASPLDTWTPLSATLVAPAGTVTAQIVLVHVQLNDPVTGGAVFFDDASLAPTAVPEPAIGTMGLMLMGGIVLRRTSRR